MSTTERYRAKCLVCGYGNCQAALINCPREMPLDVGRYIFALVPPVPDIPNRLKGVRINENGEAV
jgi:hypothetical protein